MKPMIKNSLFLLYSLSVAWLLAACADDNQEARQPKAEVSVDNRQLTVNESMTLRFGGVADQVVVYTGDKDHQYELRDSSNTGFVVNKQLFTYSYATPGTFKVVCVATTYDTFMGASQQTDTLSFVVTVVDQSTAINAISATVTPNVYYAEQTADTWVMRLPKKQLYNNREMAVNAQRQRLNISVVSDSARVFVDGAPYDARAYYDLSVRHQLRVVAHSGAVANYEYYGMVYPEFLSLSVDGTEAQLQRSAYYQDLLSYTVSGRTMTFTLEDDVKLLAGGKEVASGSDIDPQATYTLVRTHADNPQVKAVTRVAFVTQ